MGSPKYDFDVAISFLAKDEQLALQIRDALAPLRVFVFSKQQEQLAGTDGVESFRDVFRHRARIALVLYRPRWGQTPWTRVEETAIKDYCLETGWDNLMFVRLERDGTTPKWVPDSYLYLDLQAFGVGDLIGAIKAKLLRAGVELKSPTAADRARLIAAQQDFEQETRDLLRRGTEAFQEAQAELYKALDAAFIELGKSRSMQLSFGSQLLADYVAYLNGASFQLLPKDLYSNSAERAFFILRTFSGRLLNPQERAQRLMTFDQPQERGRDEVRLTRTRGQGWCWSFRGETMTSETLASLIMEELISESELVNGE